MALADAIGRARAAVDGLFDDPGIAEQIEITRDTDGAGDDILDEATGLLHPPVGDTTPVYVGPALLSPDSTRTEPRVEAGAGTYPDAYKLKVPATAPPIQVGDRVRVLDSPDAALTDRSFTIDAVQPTGRSVTRRASLHATIDGPRR